MRKLLQFSSAIFCTLMLCFCITPEIVKAADTVNVNIELQYGQNEAREMLQLVNSFRTSSEAWAWNETNTEKITYENLPGLQYDYDLEKVAMLRAAETALYYDHTRPNGTQCFTAYNSLSYPYTGAGENIAYGYRTGNAVFEAWQETNEFYNGQGHRRNMLNGRFNAIGIGHVYYNGRHYWVQEFATTASPNTTASPALEGTETVSLEVLSSAISDLSLACSKPKITMQEGESTDLPEVTMTAKIFNQPNIPIVPSEGGQIGSLEWVSANEQVAAVSADGKILAVAEGKTTISAVWNQSTVSCEVTVRPGSGASNNGNPSNNGNNSNTNNGTDNSTGKEYTVTFNANYGVVDGSSLQTTKDQKLTFLPNAIRSGYVFKGWYTQPAGGNAVTTDMQFTSDTMVYAQWEELLPDFENFSYDATDTTALVTVTIPQRYVKSWQISVGTSSNYLPDNKVIDCNKTTGTLQVLLLELKPDTMYYYRISYVTDSGSIKSDVMAFSTQKAAEYTIEFQGNGGTVIGQPSMVTVNRSLSALPEATREGFTFDGWYTDPFDGNQISTATIFESNSTVYAHWARTSDPSGPTTPTSPTEPTIPSTPVSPSVPVNPSGPTDPVTDVETGDDPNPTTVSVKTVKLKNAKNSGKGKIKVTWKWIKNNKGYQIAYSTTQDFAAQSTKVCKANAAANAKKISGLQKGKTYYVRVRAFKKKNGQTYTGGWSNVMKVKIKK